MSVVVQWLVEDSCELFAEFSRGVDALPFLVDTFSRFLDRT